MANQNPELIVGEGNKRQIASHYYPDIHPYPSGDGALIDYQIQMMRYAGIDGYIILQSYKNKCKLLIFFFILEFL